MGLSFGHCGVTAWISVKRVNKRHSEFRDIILQLSAEARSKPSRARTLQLINSLTGIGQEFICQITRSLQLSHLELSITR